MRTEQTDETCGVPHAAPDGVEDLWLDPDVEPEELVLLDPLDITSEMVEQAEQPELANYYLRRLPP
jgi:hypothetical protein